jgi:uncharacterized SAM-dependent methyltransferase
MTIPSIMNGDIESRVINNPFAGKSPFKVREQIQPTRRREIDIIDIRQDAVEMYLKDEIFNQLRPTAGPKQLPTLLLYNERGLQIYEEVGRSNFKKVYHQIDGKQITYLDEYYLVNAEIEVLEHSAENIAETIKPGSMLIELGSGLVAVR